MPKTVEDITGRRVGMLAVLSYAGKINGKPYWNCLCDCGVMKVIMGQSLRQNRIKSCGCEQYTHREGKVKPGERFGRLTVKERGDRKNFWVCECDCGVICKVKNTAMTSGHTSSCGCFHREQVVKAATKHGQSRTREYVAMQARARLEKKKRLDSAWSLEMELALVDFQPSCVLCGTDENLSTDHVLPLSKGYGLQPGNAVRLCISCNSYKHAKMLEDLPNDQAQLIMRAAAAFATAWETKE